MLVVDDNSSFRIFIKSNMREAVKKVQIRMTDDSDIFLTSRQLKEPCQKNIKPPALCRITHYSFYCNQDDPVKDGKFTAEEKEAWSDWYDFVEALPADQLETKED